MFRLCSLLVVLLEVWHASAATSNAKSVQCNAVGIGNCAACNMPGVDCYLCGAGSVMNVDYSGCTACPAYCVGCAWGKSTTVPECKACMTGYILAKDGSCTYCGAYCTSCHWTDSKQKATVCDSCLVRNGITLGGLSLSCLTCPANCKTCTEKTLGVTVCTACLDRYFLNSGSTCTACPGFCTTCTASGTGNKGSCSVCLDGYVLNDADTTMSCLACPAGCSSCNGIVGNTPGASQCTACIDGYYLDGTDCLACWNSIDGCDVCSSSSVCTECLDGWALQGTSCTACSYGCFACDFSSGAEECNDCNNYWGLQGILIGSCTRYPAHCTVCNSVGMCTTCESYYTPDDNGVCVACPANCPTCNYNANSNPAVQCVTCDATFRLNSGACSSCVTGCDSCPDDVSCNALGCSAGYYPDATSGTQLCSDCPTAIPNCLECSDATHCTLCADGYGIDGSNLCTACDANCADCGADQTVCTTCATGFTPSGVGASDCVSCTDPHCDSDIVAHCVADTCDLCASGYFQTAAGSPCTACIANCAICPDATTCTTCNTGYYPTSANTVCSSCPANCITCSSGTSCSVCVTGYVANSGTCYKCQNPSFCTGCAYSSTASNKVTCASCALGYVKSTIDLQCHACPAYCTSCQWTDSTTQTDMTCLSCQNGYGILDTKCAPCPNYCKVCSVNADNVLVCSTCNNDYILNNNFCGQCPANCLECDNQDGTMMCTVCNAGYTVNEDGSCKACPSQCTACSISNGKAICTAGKCNVGFGRNVDGTQCVACSSLAFVGCSVCSDASSAGVASCSDCANGYILDAWASACLSTQGLSNCWRPGARPYECGRKSCQSPFSWIGDGLAKGFCGLSCAVCGDIDSDDFRPASECQSSGGNYTMALIPDGCWVYRKVVGGVAMYARGGTKQFNCTADYSDEVVLANGGSVVCCSSADNCNANLELDGVAGASAITFSLALLFASILATRLH